MFDPWPAAAVELPAAAAAMALSAEAAQQQQHPHAHLLQQEPAAAVNRLDHMPAEADFQGLDDISFEQFLLNLENSPAVNDGNCQQHLALLSPQDSSMGWGKRQLQQLFQSARSLNTEDVQAMEGMSDHSFDEAAQFIDRMTSDDEALEWLYKKHDEPQWQGAVEESYSTDSLANSLAAAASAAAEAAFAAAAAAEAAAPEAAAAAAPARQPRAGESAAAAAAAAAAASGGDSMCMAPSPDPRGPPNIYAAACPAAKRAKATHPATAAAGGTSDGNGVVANASDGNLEQNEVDTAAAAAGSQGLRGLERHPTTSGLRLPVGGVAAGYEVAQQRPQNHGALPTTALARPEAAAALSRLDAALPDRVYSMANDLIYRGLLFPTPGQHIVLMGPAFLACNAPLLFEAYTRLMQMTHASDTADYLCERLFDPDNMCNTELQTVKGLTAALSKVETVFLSDTDQGLAAGIVQVAVDVKCEGLGLRAFFWRALALLQERASKDITALASSRVMAADLVRRHVYSMVHVARILVTVHNMLLPTVQAA